MAVSEQTPYIEHTGNGVTTSFSLKFQCESKDHLIVLVDEIEPPIATWSLTGGNVVFTTAPAAGKKITIQRNTPFSRTTDYQSYNNSFRPPAVNKDFDWIWLKLQELGVADWILSNRIDALKNYVDRKDDELKAYLMEEIRKQGVALDQLDNYYNYLMQRLAQIAVDKGWDASFVVYNGENLKNVLDNQSLFNDNQAQLNDKQKDKNKEIISPLDYGAKGDGSTVDTMAILDAFNSGYKVINLAGRTYKTDYLTVPAGVKIMNGVLKLNTPNTTLIKLNDYVHLDNISFIGSGNVTENLNERLIDGGGTILQTVKGVKVTGCKISDSNGYATRLEYMDDMVCCGNIIENVRYAGFMFIGAKGARVFSNTIRNIQGKASDKNAYAITFTSDTTVAVADGGRISTDCMAYGNTIENVPTWNALDTHGGNGIVFIGNVIRDCGFPIGVVSVSQPIGKSAVPPKNVIVTANTVEYTSGIPNASQNVGISVAGVPVGPIYAENIIITGNTLRRCGIPGNSNAGAIKGAYTKGLAVTGNTIIEPYCIGINPYTENIGFTVSGNVVIDPLDDTYAAPSGISIRAGNNIGTISSNTILKSAISPLATYVALIGINVSSGTTGNNVQMGVNFSNTTTRFAGFNNLVNATDLTISELSDLTTGSTNGNLTNVGTSFNQTLLNDNFAEIAAKLNQIVRILERLGIAL